MMECNHPRKPMTNPHGLLRTTLVAAGLFWLAAGSAALADGTGSGGDDAPPPTTQEPPHVSIGMELCAASGSCYSLPTVNRTIPAGSATLTVECVNDGEDDDCADTPFDKASVNGTEKDLVNSAASFDLDDLTAGETRAMEVKIRSSTHENLYEAGINFNILVQR